MCKSVNGLKDLFVYLETVGETIDPKEWHLADVRTDLEETEEEDFEAMLNDTLDVSLSISSGVARPYQDSSQDTKLIKVRYRYSKGSRKHGKRGESSRDFCRLMHSTRKVYRKEDIIKMQQDGVNSELGHNKQPYSIWLHKGGVNCYDTWERLIYIKKLDRDGKPIDSKGIKNTEKISVGKAKKFGFDPKRRKFKNNKRVAEAQIDRADKGHHPSYRGRKKK
jgi:hypothetical protein